MTYNSYVKARWYNLYMVFGGLSLTWIWSGGLMFHFENLENVIHLMLLLSFFANLLQKNLAAFSCSPLVLRSVADVVVPFGIEDKVHMN